jgi:hypothetical protein
MIGRERLRGVDHVRRIEMRVEQEDVGHELARPGERILHRLHFPDNDVARCAEIPRQRTAEFGVILGDEDAHRCWGTIDRRSATGIRCHVELEVNVRAPIRVDVTPQAEYPSKRSGRQLTGRMM